VIIRSADRWNITGTNSYSPSFVFVLGWIAGVMTLPGMSAQLRTQTDKRLITVDLAGFCDGKFVALDYSDESVGLIGNHYHPGHLFNYIEGCRKSGRCV